MESFGDVVAIGFLGMAFRINYEMGGSVKAKGGILFSFGALGVGVRRGDPGSPRSGPPCPAPTKKDTARRLTPERRSFAGKSGAGNSNETGDLAGNPMRRGYAQKKPMN